MKRPPLHERLAARRGFVFDTFVLDETVTTFPVGTIISVYRNRLFVDFADYRAFLDYMVGEHVPLWDVERARAAVAPVLHQRIKGLSKTTEPPERIDNTSRFIKSIEKELGFSQIGTPPLRPGKFTVRTGVEALT